MRGRGRATVELVLAVAALIGCAACWVGARSTEMAPPVATTEPSQVSVVYYPPLIGLALLLLAVAGVLAVVGIGRLRGGR